MLPDTPVNMEDATLKWVYQLETAQRNWRYELVHCFDTESTHCSSTNPAFFLIHSFN